MDDLRTQGYRVIAMTNLDEAVPRLMEHCDEWIEARMELHRASPLADLRLMISYLRSIRRVRPHAVLTFTIKPNIFGSIAARVLGVPSISNVTGLGTIRSRGRLTAAAVNLLYGFAFRKSRRVFFQNSRDLQEFLDARLCSGDVARLLPGSGVDTRHYIPEESRESVTGVKFCMLARLLRSKGVPEFAAAARKVRALHPEAVFELWGRLDQADSRCVTRDEIASWEAEGLLHFRGEAEDARIAFREADLVVLPTSYPEGLPRTLLEAASMGLPVIATDIAGCREAVENGVTGVLCPPGDVEALVDAMLSMIRMGASSRQAMGRKARQRVEARFDESIVFREYREALAELGGPINASG